MKTLLTALSFVTLLTPLYDFGLMKEVDGPKTGKGFLVNTSDRTLAIHKVRPSCGCTDADWQQDPIAPGDTAWFSFTYNPKGRPGHFNKTVRVLVGDGEEVLEQPTMRISGNVLGTPETISIHYPVEAGPLRLTERMIDLGRIEQGKSRHFFINGYNLSQDTIRPRFGEGPKGIDLDRTPKEGVGPGDIVTFSFYLSTRMMKQSGDQMFTIPLYPDSGAEPIEIKVHADIVSPISAPADH